MKKQIVPYRVWPLLRIVIVIPCLLLVACGPRNALKTTKIDLAREFSSVRKKSDTIVIFFGTPEGRKSLLSGWADTEKGAGGAYRSAIAKNAGFVFQQDRARPLFCHLRIKSFFPNQTAIYLNKRLVANIVIDSRTEFFTIPLPASIVRSGLNIIEMQFADLLSSPNPSDSRKLAAAAYSAVITPSKYVDETIPQPVPDLWNEETVLVAGKQVPELDFQTGGSFYSFQRLDRNAVLHFGTYYHPSQLAENDDYADFSVILKKDGAAEKVIYHDHARDGVVKFNDILLAAYVPAPDVYQIEFRLERNSLFNHNRSGWLMPSLETQQGSSSSQTGSAQDSLRQTNLDANVVIILLDAGGAKHFGCYGYPRNTTPSIDALAAESTKFEGAYCQAVYTLASSASLMSGLFPIHHRVIYTKNKLSSDIFTMPEAFESAGYDTGAFVANGNASDIFGLGQGFRTIDDVFRHPDYSGWGQDLTDSFEQWIPRAAHHKFFAYLHYREPHAPFNPPPEWKFKFVDPQYKGGITDSYETRQQINIGQLKATQQDKDFIEALYDANLNYGDYQVGVVLRKLKQLGVYDRTIVIVIADHGEAFWEHNFQGHNSQVYQESMRIPMVIKLAKGSTNVPTNANPVRTIDIYPTLVDLLDFSRKHVHVDGRSFLPYFASGASDDRQVVSQIIMERQYTLMDQNFKYLVTLDSHQEELYNLQTDLLEKQNIIASDPVRAGYLQERLFKMLASKKTVGVYFQKQERPVIDEMTLRDLRNLGYIDTN